MAKSKIIEGLKDAVRHARAQNGKPYDVCKCGDYRHGHKDGYGACMFNGTEFDLTHGGKNCRTFRFAGAAVIGLKPATT